MILFANNGSGFRAAKTPSPSRASGDGIIRTSKVIHTSKCLLRRQSLSQRENRYQNYGSQTARQNLLGVVMVFVTFHVVPVSVFVATGVQAVKLVELCTM